VLSAFTYITTNEPYSMSSDGADRRHPLTSSTLRPSLLMGKMQWGQFSKRKKAHVTPASPTVREGTDGSTATDAGGIITPHAPRKEKSLLWMGRWRRTAMTISRSWWIWCVKITAFPSTTNSKSVNFWSTSYPSHQPKKAKQEEPTKLAKQEAPTEEFERELGLHLVPK
jgi:hypothetical protein